MDYLASLGVDAVRLMPVLPSPNFDLGYDVADYYGSGPAFGTMDDFHYVGAETHVSGLKVIPDQVCSHSSHLHPWFIENAVLRGKPRVDWYVWADPRPDGGPPHNWLGRFGGFASEWNSTRKQCYLHNFLIDGPDLNLHNPEVQQAIHPVMRHWFELGVDGLRLDDVNSYITPGFPHTAYSFELLEPVLSGSHIAKTVTEAGAVGAWPCWAFLAHDVIRVATRWGAAGNPDRAGVLQAMPLPLRGSIYLYHGKGLGLPHSEVPRHRLQDPEAIRFWVNHHGRDGARTLMPWYVDGVSLAFSTVDGWWPADAGHGNLAISLQAIDPASSLSLWRALTALRQAHGALRFGSFDVLIATKTKLVFRRSHAGESLICGVNFGQTPIPFSFRGLTLAGSLASGMLGPDSYVILKETP